VRRITDGPGDAGRDARPRPPLPARRRRDGADGGRHDGGTGSEPGQPRGAVPQLRGQGGDQGLLRQARGRRHGHPAPHRGVLRVVRCPDRSVRHRLDVPGRHRPERL
ncbi:MAG: hypothetical protein AVDCRST_MAG88-19, partial [uncultured Thermomicrobiales bacterium]